MQRSRCSDDDQGFSDGGELLVVPDEPPALHDPREGAFDDPAPFDDDEAFRPWHAAYDFQHQIGLVLGPDDQLSGITAVRKDPLDEGIEAARVLQQAFGAVAILHIGTMHLDPQQPAVGVGQDMALAAVDFLARVEAFPPPF